jgi:5S rRNA maturation endonuclease (ribonuclease M5)
VLTEAQKNWFKYNKGIEAETLEAFGVHSDNDYEWVVLPYPNGDKKRYIGPGKRQFASEKGLHLGLYHGPMSPESYCFLVEGETDTMRLWQQGVHSVYGIPGAYGLKDTDVEALKSYETIYVILDNDADYNTEAKIEKAWTSIRSKLGPHAKRLTLPEDVKDIVEFFESYTMETFKEIVKEASTGKYHYAALDLSAPPPEYRWLVDGIIAQGDTTLLVGEPNVGKSWVSLSLAVAMANGEDRWIDWPLNNHGRVLYVDEENPHDVVYHRLKQLGLNNFDNMRYLHRQGVRLDRRFDKFLDEAVSYQPSLIVLDSLTRLHTQDENNAGAMAGLFNDSINVLTKETGAAIIVLHHTNKGDASSSYTRTRGSSDIGAAVDCGLEARAEAPGRFRLIHFKSRRKQAGNVTHVQIRDTSDDKVALETVTPTF